MRFPVSTALSMVAIVAVIVIGHAGCIPTAAAPDGGAPCRPSASFFAAELYPRFLDFNGCGRNTCHAIAVGGGYFRLAYAIDAPLTEPDPDRWPEAWRNNYYASIQQVRCDDPTHSRLLLEPADLADPHPPGNTVNNLAEAEDLFRRWIPAP